MHWFPLLLRNGLVGAALLLVSQTLAPVLYLWTVGVLLLVLLWTLHATVSTLWRTSPRPSGWVVLGVCWGVFLLATGAYFAVGHLRRGQPLPTLFDAEPALLAVFAGGGVVSLLVVAAVWSQHSALNRRTS